MDNRYRYEGLLIPLLCLFILSGCSRINTVVNYPADEQDNKISLTFFGNKYEAENVTVIEEIISGFMQENPGVRVSYESLKGSGYYDALDKRIKAGKGDDIFMVNHDMVLELKSGNHLMDLSGLAVLPGYTERMREQMEEEDGSIFWVPTTISVFGLYCNMDLLKQHGQAVPENLPQLKSVCSYFLEQGITPVIANNDISLKTVAIGRSFYHLYQGGQQETFHRINRGEESLGQYLRPGFLLVRDLIDSGYVDAASALVTKKTSDDLKLFAEGKSPFMLTGAWAVAHLKGLGPDFEFQIVPYPIMDDGAVAVINADTRLSINADSRYPEEAKAFVEYFTRPVNIQKFADQQASFSPLKGGYPSTVEEIQPLIPCYQSGRVVIGSDGELELPVWELTREVSKQLLEGKSLDEAMDWLDHQAEGAYGIE